MNELTSRYSIAFVEAMIETDKENAEIYRDEMYAFIQILKKHPKLGQFLGVIDIKFEDKEKMIKSTFSNYHDLTLNFILLIVSKNRAYFLKDILTDTYVKINSYLKVDEGIIYSSKALDEKTIKEITDALEKKKAHKVLLTNVVDEKLIGGFKIIMSNDVYDTSIKTQLERLKKSLLKDDK